MYRGVDGERSSSSGAPPHREGASVMDGRVLGPIGFEVGGRKEALGTRKEAELLALLVTSEGLGRSREEIVEILWPEEKDEKKRRDLINSVVRELRKRLGKEFLPHAGRSGRCTLRLPSGSFDYLRFLEGRRRAEGLPPSARFECLRVALGEWGSGDPLWGLLGPHFELLREKLRRERIDAVCELLRAAWEDRPGTFLPEEARKWFALFPENHHVFAYYLLAHEHQQMGESLERTVAQWIECHGEPGEFLQTVIDRLRGEEPREGRSRFLSVPDQLPPEKRVPVGQEKLLGELVDLVEEAQSAGRGLILLLSGMAGVGKSTVALHLAHRLRGRFPDGALYGELNGHTDGASPADPEIILDGFLAALPPYPTVRSLEAKGKELRSALAHRSALIFLDNALNVKQVKELLPGTGACVAIVTSRNELGALYSWRGVHPRRVELLGDDDALRVLQENVAEKEWSNCAQAFAQLIRHCGNLPLALTVVGRRLAHRSANTIHALVKEMDEERRRLESLHLPEEELSVRVALNCSVRDLSAEAVLLLWQLAVHPGPGISWEAVMDLGMAAEEQHTDKALGELQRANLVELRSDRYRLHDLVRTFARHHLTPVSPEERDAVEAATLHQVMEHQLHNVRACDRVLDSQRALPIGDPEGVRVFSPEDPAQAMEWMDKEYETTRQCLELARRKEMDRYAWLLPTALVTYQWRRSLFRSMESDLREAAETAERAGASPVECAMVHRMLAGTQWRLSEFGKAAATLARAVLLSREDDSGSGRLSLARSLYALGITHRKKGEETAAEERLRQALDLYQELGEPVGEAMARNAIGVLHLDEGDCDQALQWCEGARRLIERTADHSGQADVLFTLAKVRLARAEREEGIALYTEACAIYQAQECWTDEDKTRRLFAEVLVSAGRAEEAVWELERVLVLREQMDTDTNEIRDLLETLR
ncbi:tetratricopeptide repeat protein [Streptomyces sp. NPDC092359]|uniref:AfsR/SARP family transcriptional regulator n=1 Tax=Streptomyces sp. NPDC092359 TaxID=3366014 RepID=UPI003820E939